MIIVSYTPQNPILNIKAPIVQGFRVGEVPRWKLTRNLQPVRCRLLFLNRPELPKIRGTLFWGPYSKDPTI